MSHYLIRQIRDTGNIQVRPTPAWSGPRAPTTWSASASATPATGRSRRSTGYLFVFIGAAPCTEWLDGVVERDRKGFVVTGPDLLAGGRRPRGWPLDRDPYYLEASVPGVFAAGDARTNSVKRVASAVGEGAMAIQLVHRYLEARDRAARPAALAELFLFEKLSDEQLAWLAERGQVRSYEAGATVYRVGEPATCLYLLLEGTL